LTLLDEALARADEEFYIFPLRENDKRPAVSDWENWATLDKDKIKTYWKAHPKANIGVACGPSGIVVLDVDNKDKENLGSITLANIELTEGEVPTFTVKTPTGGYHKYYQSNGSELKNTTGKLGKGLDTRAKGGYVVSEGSWIGGKKYLYVGGDFCNKLPQWIIQGTKQRVEIIQTEEKEASAIDITRAENWLTHQAPHAVQGHGGDQTTYDIACVLRDFGLDKKWAFQLMIALWNPKCAPPWHPDDIRTKIDNAFAYAQNSKGAKAFEGMFEDLTIKGLHPMKASEIAYMLPQRDWVLGHRLIIGFVTVTVAPGGVGKSMYTMVEALAVATGKPLLGETPRKIGPVVIYNTEDPLDEIQRRIQAICIQYEIDLEKLSNVYLLSGIDEPLRLARTIQGVTQVTKDNDKLIKLVKDTGAILLCVDPFIRTHLVQENDNNAIDTVVQCFSKLANQCKCSISIVHHTRKMPAGTGAGDMDIARGASSLVSASRIATTLTIMGEKEAKSLQIPEHERHWYIRSDNAKGNMSAPVKHAHWFKKISVRLPNGDSVGTLECVDLTANYSDKELVSRLEAESLVKELHETLGLGDFKLTDAMKVMEKINFSGEAPATLRRKLISMYEMSVVSGDIKVVHLYREAGTPRHVIEISLA